jgi:glucose/mannose-6-phosphate isomerase
MNLDDVERIHTLDPEGMLAEIDSLPDQLQSAWDLGRKMPLADISGVRQVVVAGMGGSAIGADLVAAYIAHLSSVPMAVWRGYDLPAYVLDSQTLVIVSSHSGNTEEAISAFERGLETGAQVLAVTTGGELASRAESHGVPVWRFNHDGQPRAAVGYSFGLLLAAFSRMGFIPDPVEEVKDAVAAMQRQRESLLAQVKVTQNPAKRMAGQMIDRWPIVVGAGLLGPVARRWRTQISELAKALAQFEVLPEADHNMAAGVLHPDPLISNTVVIFLSAPLEHRRNQLRIEATRQIFMREGFGTDIIEAQGETRLAQQWTCLHFGDYTAFYLAMAYGVDPTPVQTIEDLKERLRTDNS